MVDEIADKYRGKGINVVISVGGGSVMDAGKAVSAMLVVEYSVRHYLEGIGDMEHPGRKIPFIAMPTTSGTGSEMTKNAVKNLILDLDVQGAINMKKKYPDALYIFVIPPTLKELEIRLVNRENKIDKNVRERLGIAKEELKHYKLYDYIVINDMLDQALAVMDAIIISFLNTTLRNEKFIKKIVGE